MDNNTKKLKQADMGRMYQQYRGLVHKYVQEHAPGGAEEANDITEEVFERTWHYYKDLEEPVRFEKKLIMKIAHDVCVRLQENHKNRYEVVYTGASIIVNGEERSLMDEIVENPENWTEQVFEREELLRVVYHHLALLPSEIQQAVVLHYLEGKTYEEISSHLNRATSTVKSDVRKGLDQLRVHLVSNTQTR